MFPEGITKKASAGNLYPIGGFCILEGDPMTEESFKRKLTAILSADVEGYSRLMGEDEDATIRTLTSYRELMSTLIQKHRGRVVDSPGDNLLAEFLSVVDAVRCAVEIQEELRVRNAELPENRRMEFRIGINLGDVVQEEERIYGDGINIAARVEGLAEGGGICISGTVYDSIKNKLSLSYESLGEHTVKNITEPVRVYRMRVGPEAVVKTVPRRWHKASLAAVVVLVVAAGAWAIWNFYFRPPPIEPASVEKMAYPLPDKPSIAVLPFLNMSEDKEQEYFSDGLTEEIITALSKVPKLFVIARNSTFTYKGKPVKVQQVSEDLGVRYVLEGSVRKDENRVRITAQLIDAITGHHVWSERYDRDLKDIFALQDEITMKVINALQVELTEGEHARLWGKGTDNLQAYLKSLRAREYYLTQTKEDNDLARRTAEEAIALDPEYAPPYHFLSITHFMDILFRTTKSPKQSMTRAVELIQKAIALDDSYALAHGWLGFLYAWLRKYEESIMEAQKGVALSPNGAHGYLYLSMVYRFAGRFEEAVQAIEKAIRLNPFPPNTYFRQACGTYISVGRYEEAIASGKKAVKVGPNDLMAHMLLAAAYSLAGRQEEARIAAEEVLRLNPRFSLAFWRKLMPFKNQADRGHVIGALRKAGLPDKPPLQLPDKPSIAVLPFVNMSDDPKQEYFSDGITEEIITALSKTPKLFVIARNSTFTYKGKPTKVQQVGRELGVKYVLEGSVRKAGDKVRITAQLVDAKTGHHLWAERYDRNMEDIFAVQDEITMKIITALQVKLAEGEQARSLSRGVKNLQTYLKWLEGLGYIREFSREKNVWAKQMAKEVILLDPEYVRGYSLLAYAHLYDVWLGLSKSPKESFRRAVKLAKKAILIDPLQGDPHRVLAHTYILMRRSDAAIAEAERALEMEPGSADAHTTLGHVLLLSGRHQEAIAILEKAMRLNPYPPSWYFLNLASAYHISGRLEEAIRTYKKAIEKAPNNQVALINLTHTYVQTGRLEEARATAKDILRANPRFSVEQYILKGRQRGRDKFSLNQTAEALRKAGLK